MECKWENKKIETGQPSKEIRKPHRLETSAAATAVAAAAAAAVAASAAAAAAAAATENKKIANTQQATPSMQRDESAYVRKEVW